MVGEISWRLDEYKFLRIGLARYLAVALEFQLAADIIATSVAPGWDQLGRLGAIALIRTFLNYFLGREMAEQDTAAQQLNLPRKNWISEVQEHIVRLYENLIARVSGPLHFRLLLQPLMATIFAVKGRPE
jgi:hypothetical protein